MKKYKIGGELVERFGWARRDFDDGPSGTHNEPPPIYEKGDGGAPQAQGRYVAEKTYSRQSSLRRTGTWGSQQGSLRRTGPRDSHQAGLRRTGTWGSQNALLRKPATEEEDNTLSDVIAGYQTGSETLQNTNPNLIVGGRISDNQVALANQPSDPYSTTKQQGPYRISQLSSLSSGFGDGDIVIAQPVLPQPLTAPPPVAAQPLRASDNDADRASWFGRPNEKRETVYTQASEDRPIRFRSINSWVNQQTGRVQRASSRARERGEVPVMPAIPGELNVTQQTAYR